MMTTRHIIKYILDTYLLFESRFVRAESHSRPRLLIFRKDGIGDYLLFLPTLHYYEDHFADHDSYIVVDTGAKDILRFFNFRSHVIDFDYKKFSANFWYRRNFFHTLKKLGFTTVLYPVITRESIGDTLIKVTDASTKIGVRADTESDTIYGRLLNADPELNELDQDISLAEQVIGQNIHQQFPLITDASLDTKRIESVRTKFNLPERFCVIFPGSRALYKVWPAEKFAAVIDHVCEKQVHVALCGGPGDRAVGEQIASRVHRRNHLSNLIGKTTLTDMVYILHEAEFYFGNDTSALHFAALLDRPAIAIMGKGHFRRFFPYGDLQKNRVVFDPEAPCENDGWACAVMHPHEPAPCIKNIPIKDAVREIDAIMHRYDHA